MGSRDTNYTLKFSMTVKKGRESEEEDNVLRKDLSWKYSITEDGESRPMTGGGDFWNELVDGRMRIVKGVYLNPFEHVFKRLNLRMKRVIKPTVIPSESFELEMPLTARQVVQVEDGYAKFMQDLANLGKRGYRTMAKTRKGRRTRRGRGE